MDALFLTFVSVPHDVYFQIIKGPCNYVETYISEQTLHFLIYDWNE